MNGNCFLTCIIYNPSYIHYLGVEMEVKIIENIETHWNVVGVRSNTCFRGVRLH